MPIPMVERCIEIPAATNKASTSPPQLVRLNLILRVLFQWPVRGHLEPANRNGHGREYEYDIVRLEVHVVWRVSFDATNVLLSSMKIALCV